MQPLDSGLSQRPTQVAGAEPRHFLRLGQGDDDIGLPAPDGFHIGGKIAVPVCTGDRTPLSPRTERHTDAASREVEAVDFQRMSR